MEFKPFSIQGLVAGKFETGETPTIKVGGKELKLTQLKCNPPRGTRVSFDAEVNDHTGIHGEFYPATNGGQISLPDELVTEAGLSN